MKKEILFFGVMILFIIPSLDAQHFLSKSCNLFRGNDHLVKQQVEYKAPGRSGDNVFWDFSRQELINDHYRLDYRAYDDSLCIGQEHKTLYKYRLSGDTVYSCGFENPTTLVTESRPSIFLIFPFHYKEKHENYFHANGDYCNRLFLTLTGKTSVEADAYGTMLLPSGDTLRHVLRIHQSREIAQRMFPYNCILASDTIFCTDSTDYYLANDSLTLQSETYRWYAEGYRYPVFETVETITLIHGNPVSLYNTAFMYTPSDQYYDLNNDLENQVRRDAEQARLEAERNAQAFEGNNDLEADDENITYSVNVSQGGNELIIEYVLAEQSDLTFILFDIQSRQLTQLSRAGQSSGTYRESISLTGLQPGEYTLRIMVNGKVFGVKIIK